MSWALLAVGCAGGPPPEDYAHARVGDRVEYAFVRRVEDYTAGWSSLHVDEHHLTATATVAQVDPEGVSVVLALRDPDGLPLEWPGAQDVWIRLPAERVTTPREYVPKERLDAGGRAWSLAVERDDQRTAAGWLTERGWCPPKSALYLTQGTATLRQLSDTTASVRDERTLTLVDAERGPEGAEAPALGAQWVADGAWVLRERMGPDGAFGARVQWDILPGGLRATATTWRSAEQGNAGDCVALSETPVCRDESAPVVVDHDLADVLLTFAVLATEQAWPARGGIGTIQQTAAGPLDVRRMDNPTRTWLEALDDPSVEGLAWPARLDPVATQSPGDAGASVTLWDWGPRSNTDASTGP